MAKKSKKDKMIALREQGLTLREIAKKFGVCYQYVQKVVGNTGNKSYWVKRQKRKEFILNNPDKTNDELANIMGVCTATIMQDRTGTRYKIKGGQIGKNVKWQNWSISELKKMGFSAKGMPNNCLFDLYVGEWRVNVRYSGVPNNSPSNKLVSSQWIFNVGANKREDCDFYFCITANNDVFIIPSQEIPDSMTRIQFCYPTKRPSIGKYQKYRNAYHLFTSKKYDV